MSKKTKTNSEAAPEENFSVKKIAISLFILAIIYCNASVILARSPLTLKLPAPKVALDLFDVFSVFAYYETINRDFLIEGLKVESNDPENAADWIDLGIVDKYFPHSLGEQQMRLFLSKHFSQGNEFHLNSYRGLTEKIRLRYNREHPENQISKVAISYIYWPRSFKGYRALKLPDTEQKQLLYMESN
jgi:hypothetical protein